MRFLHNDLRPIELFFGANSCDIRRLEWDLNPVEAGSFAFLPWTVKRRPARPPETTTLKEIGEYFHRADKPEDAGTVLFNYFHVNAPLTDRAVSLPGAVEHVEAFGAPMEFLLVGYPDGGLISISRHVLSFQEGLEQAHWWGPR